MIMSWILIANYLRFVPYHRHTIILFFFKISGFEIYVSCSIQWKYLLKNFGFLLNIYY